VWGLGFRVWSLGFRVHDYGVGSGLRVSGSELRAKCR
jgi:hypothetical protein